MQDIYTLNQNYFGTDKDLESIDIRRATGFHGRQNYFPKTVFYEKISARWSNEPGRNVLTGSQFEQWLALKGRHTPGD